MSGTTVQLAQSEEEIAAVRELFRAYGDHLSRAATICIENLAAEIASLPDPYSLLLLATVDGQPAGCVALKPLPRESERACELKRLWVSPFFRGQRMGRLLMEAAIVRAADAGFTAMYLDTVPAAMPEANQLYDKLGFQRTVRYNTNPVKNVVFFRLDLPASAGPLAVAENPNRFRNPPAP